MILVDTSVWVNHLRGGVAQLTRLLHDELVLGHPMVVGELACGHLRQRAEILGRLTALPQAPSAADHEVLLLVEQHRLSGQGLGWVDVHLLAAAAIQACSLWTHDQALATAAERLGVEPRF